MSEAGRMSEEADAPDAPEGLSEDDLRSLDPDELKRLVEARRRARRGRPRRPNDPRALKKLVDGLLEKWGLADAVARAELFQQWEDRMGQKVAERARPVGFDEGTLFVEVESASWLSELRMMKRQLLERLNAGRKRGRIEEIVFVQGGRSGEGRAGGDSRRGGRDSGRGDDGSRDDRRSERSRRNQERGRS